ncbi:MAG: ComEA family DNA-binding protein [Hafnia sp.]
MRNIVLTYLLLPLFVGLSFSLNAAPGVPAEGLTATHAVNSQPQSQLAKLNLNIADAQTLQTELSGIGKAKAEAIVAYRETHGSFASVDELLEIKGIGNALFERNRERLIVE